MMPSAARSFTLPPGLRNSALPRMVQPVSWLGPFRVSSGVLPIRLMISGAFRMARFYALAGQPRKEALLCLGKARLE